MCGICGFVGKSDRSKLAAMTAALRHRGPDDEAFFVSDQACLGARRLAIVDVDHGRQPMTSEDGSIVVVFNGEIYNADALRRQLQARGHRFSTRCDTEVIPHLYEECGDGFAQVLNGQFAIAVWEVRNRRLLLTRDRIGIKPLFFGQRHGRFFFGSELKSILAGLGEPPPISLEAFYHYLSFKCVPAPLTIYEGLSAVRPAEQVVFHDGRVTRRSYWSFDGAVTEAMDEREAVDRLDAALARSVKRRMIADVPVGAMLSGGLDSSLIVSYAAELSDRPLQTFTLGFTDDFANKRAEIEAARKVARLFGTEHHEHFTTHEELLAGLPGALRAFDEPFAGVMSPYFLNRLVRQHVKVCLSGDGADELFGSYLAHRLAQPVRQVLSRGADAVRRAPHLLAPFEKEVERVIAVAHRQDWAWRASLLVFSDQEKRELLNPDYPAFATFSTAAMVRSTFARCRTNDVQNRQQEYDCRTLLPDLVLNFNDRLSMAHSIETRVPFLDHELTEYAFALPGRMKIRDGCCKWLLKQVGRRRLPDEIVDRPKEGFVMPINAWQRSAFRQAIEQTLTPKRLARHGFFRPQRVQNLVREYYAGETDLQYKVWALYCFQTWYEGAVDGYGADESAVVRHDALDMTPVRHNPASDVRVETRLEQANAAVTP